MVEDAQGLAPVLLEQVDLLKQALAGEQERARHAESLAAHSETVRLSTCSLATHSLIQI